MTAIEIKEAKENLEAVKAAFRQPHKPSDVAKAMLVMADVLERLLQAQAQANAAPHGSMR